MLSIKEYFANMPDLHRLLILLISIMFFWYIENIRYIISNYRKWRHLSVNGLFSFTAIPVQIALGLLILRITDYNAVSETGLIHIKLFSKFNSLGLQCIVVFIALDFLEYVYHVAMHTFKRLWMMHVVHHSDQVVDVTTTLREHPLETLTRLCFLVLFIYLTGAEYWMLMVRQAIQVISNVLAHANFRLPERTNAIIGKVFITPNIHQVHHHHELPYTNMNYGDVLSIWDHLFGTFGQLDKDKITYGVDTFKEINANTNFRTLLGIPLKKYRPTIKKP